MNPSPPENRSDRIDQRRRRLVWVERCALLAGLALLSAYAWGKVNQESGSRAAVESFRAASAEPYLLASAGFSATTSAPDQSLWSEQRIAEYEHSVAASAGELPLAVLRMPRLGIEAPVYNGTDDFNLNRGVGRIPGTARLEQEGNLGIAGHRDGFFRALKDAREDDVLELETLEGVRRYRVGSFQIVDPSDVSVLAPTQEATITLVTCYPFYFVGSAPQRFIVTAVAEDTESVN